MPTDDYVLNEYVHVDWINTDSGQCCVYYEPLDEIAFPDSIDGKICLGSREVRFRHGNHCLLVDADDVLAGHYIPESNILGMVWEEHPGEHYLVVNYLFGSYKKSEIVPKLAWVKEGF